MKPIQVERWRCRKTDSPYRDIGGKHFITGYVPHEDSAHLSSAVKHYNAKTGIVKCHDGEVIELVGEPGESRDAEQLWRVFCRKNRVREEHDISSRYLRRA